MSNRHPEPERLAEYAEGGMASTDRAEIQGHLAACARCREIVTETVAILAAETNVAEPTTPRRVLPFRARRWVTGVAAALAAAAIIVLAIRIARPQWLFGPRSDRPELQELVATLANEPTRPVEGRLTGGFSYAPPPSVTRGPGDREVSPEVRIAAAKIEKAARESHNTDLRAALGVAYLVLGALDKAIDVLEMVTAEEPDNPRFQTDLAAAYLERAKRRGRSDDLPKALAAADRALRIHGDLPEALFNRALVLEALHLGEQAERAWQTYSAVEPDSRWRTEARARPPISLLESWELPSSRSRAVIRREANAECSGTIAPESEVRLRVSARQVCLARVAMTGERRF